MADIETTAYFRDDFVPFNEANLSIASASVLYGLSTYTVFPLLWNRAEQEMYIFRLEDHFRRLQNSSKILAFDDFNKDWDYKKFLNVIRQLIKINHVRQDCVVRVCVFVDDSLKGTRMHGLKHSLSAFIYSTPPLLPKSGARLMVSSWRRTPDNAIPSRAKINGSYVNASLMKHEAIMSGFDDALGLDEQGHVTEGTVANAFLVRDGRLLTADNSTDLLEGITRDSVIQMGQKLGLQTEKRVVDRSELYIADEIFLCGSSVQITPVIEVDHRKVGSGKPGRITTQLMEKYANITQQAKDFKDWLTPVNMLQ